MSDNFFTLPAPQEIRYQKEERILRVHFDDQHIFSLPAELLRVESPSAEVQGHGVKKPPVSGRRHVAIIGIEPVGNYAIKLVFDDLHDTGIYTWEKLWNLGIHQKDLWKKYLEALQRHDLSRDP